MNTKNMKVTVNRSNNNVILTADEGYVLTNTDMSLSGESIYYEYAYEKTFCLTPYDLGIASTYSAITEEEHIQYLAAKEAAEEELANAFLNLGDEE